MPDISEIINAGRADTLGNRLDLPSRYKVSDKIRAMTEIYFSENVNELPAPIRLRYLEGEPPDVLMNEIVEARDFGGSKGLEDLSFRLEAIKKEEKDRGIIAELLRFPVEHPFELGTLIYGGAGVSAQLTKGGFGLARVAKAGRLGRGAKVGATDAALQVPFTQRREKQAFRSAVSARQNPAVAKAESLTIGAGEVLLAGGASFGLEVLADWLSSAVRGKTLTPRQGLAVEAGIARSGVPLYDISAELAKGDQRFVGSVVTSATRGSKADAPRALMEIDADAEKLVSEGIIVKEKGKIYADLEKASENEVSFLMNNAGVGIEKVRQIATREAVETGALKGKGYKEGDFVRADDIYEGGEESVVFAVNKQALQPQLRDRRDLIVALGGKERGNEIVFSQMDNATRNAIEKANANPDISVRDIQDFIARERGERQEQPFLPDESVEELSAQSKAIEANIARNKRKMEGSGGVERAAYEHSVRTEIRQKSNIDAVIAVRKAFDEAKARLTKEELAAYNDIGDGFSGSPPREESGLPAESIERIKEVDRLSGTAFSVSELAKAEAAQSSVIVAAREQARAIFQRQRGNGEGGEDCAVDY